MFVITKIIIIFGNAIHCMIFKVNTKLQDCEVMWLNGDVAELVDAKDSENSNTVECLQTLKFDKCA